VTIDPDTPVRNPAGFGELAGRRMRCLARLLDSGMNGVRIAYDGYVILTTVYPPTYREMMTGLQDGTWPGGHDYLAHLPLRTGENRDVLFDRIDETVALRTPNASLHSGLQDLAYALTVDIIGACDAYDNPDVYYPGVDEGIEPVTDEHIKLVMWGMNRELLRELRHGRPAVTLADLPWRIQRALAERRRLRYLQWGIGQEQYERGTWSLWDVPEEPEWVPGRIFD
jgi:hypothetical protein